MGIGELLELKVTELFDKESNLDKNLMYGNIKRITKQHGLVPQVLVCSVCKKPVERGFMSGQTAFFSCYHCDMWVSNVEWKSEPFMS